jgi:rhodanese-related sulfurtransferase
MILRILWQSAALLLLAAAGAWATWRWHPERPELYLTAEPAGPDEITVADALALEKEKGVIWIDARRRPEFEKGHIPGAFLLNIYEWDDLMMPVVHALGADDPRRTVIIYCDAQKCASSRELRERMLDFGLGDFDIRVLHGGWPAWQAAQKQDFRQR